MNITSAQYIRNLEDTENSLIQATIDDNIVSVPLDSANRHYQEIQEWVAAGNKIEEAD